VRVIIAGGHGQVALRLERLLAARADEAVGLVRNPGHVADVADAGATASVIDLEHAGVDEVSAALRGGDAVVFAAGAGPGSGIARKDTVDRAAAALVADAAEQVGVRRFLLVSSMGAGSAPRPGADDVFAAYLRAKTASEDDLRRRDLDWTILRPGGLTNDPGTGLVTLAATTGRGPVPRDDVAAVLLGLLDEPRTSGATLELISGATPIRQAIIDTVGPA
jgi:uncharacterized protein YbjT (DUF2867 family)